MQPLKLYIAGKVSSNSVFGRHDWRADFCDRLAQKIGRPVINLDPVVSHSDFELNENDSRLVFGRDCFLIRSADVVVVYLSDDISVGGSQEMLIAKYYGKPLIGLAPYGGKFYKAENEIGGRKFKNWVHPFVNVTCDRLVKTEEELAEAVVKYSQVLPIKDFSVLRESEDYYLRNFYGKDNHVNNVCMAKVVEAAQKGLVVDVKSHRFLAVKFKNNSSVRSELRGRLALPGGRFSYDETPDSSFQREVREETGVEIKPGRPVSNYDFKFERRKVLHHIFATVRLAAYVSGEIKTPIVKDEFDLEKAVWIDWAKIKLNNFVTTEAQIIYSCRGLIGKMVGASNFN